MRRKCDISSGPRSGGLTTMIADPKKSESKAKTIAGQLPNRLPMRDSALGAASGLSTEARCSISSPNHEIALFEIPAVLRPRADDLSPESIDVCSRKGHLNYRPPRGARRLVGSGRRSMRAGVRDGKFPRQYGDQLHVLAQLEVEIEWKEQTDHHPDIDIEVDTA